MKNEAVRVFFAVIALILVALLTSPGIDSPLNHPVQRRIAALEAESKAKPKKVIRVKRTVKKITVSRI